jgi:DNA-directed RNA polymerase specialized sigma24 family protein
MAPARVLARAAQDQLDEAIFAWLKVVATREAVRMLRVERNRPTVDPDGGDLPLGLGETADSERVVDAHDALELVAQLPLRQARMFGLHVAGLSYEEIADLTGDSRRTGRAPAASGPGQGTSAAAGVNSFAHRPYQ